MLSQPLAIREHDGRSQVRTLDGKRWLVLLDPDHAAQLSSLPLLHDEACSEANIGRGFLCLNLKPR